MCIQGRALVALDLALLEYEVGRQPRKSVTAITISESVPGAWGRHEAQKRELTESFHPAPFMVSILGHHPSILVLTDRTKFKQAGEMRGQNRKVAPWWLLPLSRWDRCLFRRPWIVNTNEAIPRQSCASRLWGTSTCCCLRGSNDVVWLSPQGLLSVLQCDHVRHFASSFHSAWALAKVHLKKRMKNLSHLGLDSLCLFKTEESEAKQEKTKGLPAQKGQDPGGGFIEAVSTHLADGYGGKEAGEKGLNEALSCLVHCKGARDPLPSRITQSSSEEIWLFIPLNLYTWQ